MAYTPYAQDGSCKSADVVAQDIASIKGKGFNGVRIYATDCSGLPNVGNACRQNGMKMIVGIFIDGGGLGPAHEQLNQLATWGKDNWDLVEMVVVGNEAIFAGHCSASDLAGFIGEVRNTLRGVNYNGPVTTTEPLNIIQANAEVICGCVDVIAANLHSFFNGQTTADHAGDLVAKQLEDLAAACGGTKPAYNLESGWPSNGNANNLAVPGIDEQKQAIGSIIQHAGNVTVIFSYEDDLWKHPGDFNIEQYWGCSKLFD
jgi:exo-beta-1,3-glucanase (GH17 family)